MVPNKSTGFYTFSEQAEWGWWKERKKEKDLFWRQQHHVWCNRSRNNWTAFESKNRQPIASKKKQIADYDYYDDTPYDRCKSLTLSYPFFIPFLVPSNLLLSFSWTLKNSCTIYFLCTLFWKLFTTNRIIWIKGKMINDSDIIHSPIFCNLESLAVNFVWIFSSPLFG